MIRFRTARAEDVPYVVAMLVDDILGAGRELSDMEVYQGAFARMQTEGGNLVIVGADAGGRIVATYQITFISGLSLAAARRAQIESVRVASDLRGQGIGHQMFADMKMRAADAGCSLIQLTMNQSRKETHRFYESLGFAASHTGFKYTLG